VKSREALKANLDALLQQRGKTRNQMVVEMGRSSAWISQILSGKRSVFLDKLDAISGYLGVEPAALFITAPSVTPQLRAVEHDDNTPSLGTSIHGRAGTERAMSDEDQKDILLQYQKDIILGYCRGVISDHPHAFAVLKRAVKDATDRLQETLDEEASSKAREAKAVGKS
jgi:transcriptional regulator with XRE-family HTH domain